MQSTDLEEIKAAVICRIKNTVCQIICDAAKRFQQMASAS